MTPYDLWRLDNAIQLETDAEQAARIINSHIADSLDLKSMNCLAVADDDRVLLFVGEFQCDNLSPYIAVRHWRGLVSNALRAALHSKETT